MSHPTLLGDILGSLVIVGVTGLWLALGLVFRCKGDA